MPRVGRSSHFPQPHPARESWFAPLGRQQLSVAPRPLPHSRSHQIACATLPYDPPTPTQNPVHSPPRSHPPAPVSRQIVPLTGSCHPAPHIYSVLPRSASHFRSMVSSQFHRLPTAQIFPSIPALPAAQEYPCLPHIPSARGPLSNPVAACEFQILTALRLFLSQPQVPPHLLSPFPPKLSNSCGCRLYLRSSFLVLLAPVFERAIHSFRSLPNGMAGTANRYSVP